MQKQLITALLAASALTAAPTGIAQQPGPLPVGDTTAAPLAQVLGEAGVPLAATIPPAPETGFVMLSRGPWQDAGMAAYRQRFNTPPLVLPLTHTATSSGDAILTGDAAGVYYLYVRQPADKAAQDEQRQRLRALLSNDNQQRLLAQRYERLPPSYEKLWDVRLGVIPPAFPGGDY
ncbi:hypothetical protein [Uliginosibacterium sp. H1]|uniref:hypothetical protein n=1 Tax=Uliginosibacterium sp. H1 TaxID=3114757 RepID=UPI002E18ECD9|nr:hypothetical protein [Uliginosibacterium sp. H1]